MGVVNAKPGTVVKTDVLVLGGGIAGCLAAIKSRESGLSTLVVDKGNIGRSGLSHQMSGVLTYFHPETDDHGAWYGECVEAGQWLADQKCLGGMIAKTTECINDLEKWGVSFQKERGSFIRRHGVGHHYASNIIMTYGGFQLMSVLRGEILRRGVGAIERVMVTDLLTSDGELPTGGKICGAVGFNSRTGEFYVFEAKTIVIATGSTNSIFPVMQVPSLSGDGKAMAFRAGCEMRNIELSFYVDYPRDFNCAPGANILFGEGAILVNAKGERFMHKYDSVRLERATRVVRTLAMSAEEREGRGPVYLDATHLDEAAHHRIEMAIPTIIKSFALAGLSLKRDNIPYITGASDLGPGGIRVNERGETTVPGLYAAGATTDHAEDGVTNIITHGMEAAIHGYRAGEAAAKYATEVGSPAINETQVKLLKEGLFSPIERESGLKHKAVRENCMLMWDKGSLGPIRSEKGLKEAIYNAKEIRENQIPKLVAMDYHELTRSIGLGNELLFIELLTRCALVRTESRGSHYRGDYPERDDANWLKWVIAKREGNGIKVWAEPIPYEEYPLKPEIAD
ncbi:FAD-dependent oxidoreductase [Chloroflexota bacterium]